jgi:hypothetical protein
MNRATRPVRLLRRRHGKIPSGTSGVTLTNVRDLYWVVMVLHPSGDVLNRDTYWGPFVTAQDILSVPTHKDRWIHMGCWNGTDKQIGYETMGC